MIRQNKSKILSKLSKLFVPQRSNNYRPELLHPDHILVLAFIVVGFFALVQTLRFFPSVYDSVLSFHSTITSEEVIRATNQKRQEQGLPPLTANSQLSAAALAKAQHMIDNQYWSHTSPDGKKPWDFIKAANYQYQVAGENLARDFGNTNDMMQAWMDSSTHKANILNERYQEIGVAMVQGKFQGFESVLIVQMFGTPTGAASQIGDSAVDEPAQQPAVHNPVLALEEKEAQVEDPVVRETEQKSDAAAFDPDDTQTVNSNQKSEELVAEDRPISSSIFTPLQLTKAAFLAVIMLIILTLIYDSFVIGSKKNMRLVGENLGHIILFMGVAFLMIVFQGGVIK